MPWDNLWHWALKILNKYIFVSLFHPLNSAFYTEQMHGADQCYSDMDYKNFPELFRNNPLSDC